MRASSDKLARASAHGLLLLAILFMFIMPSSWWHDHRHALWELLESPLIPGRQALYVLLLAMTVVGATLIALNCLRERWTVSGQDLTSLYIPRSDLVAFIAWLSVMISWLGNRLMRYGLQATWQSWQHMAITFGLMAMINFQVLLLPISRSSPILALLGKPSERLVSWHRFAGKATVGFVMLHGGFFIVRWSSQSSLMTSLAEWPAHGVANLPGVVSAAAMIVLALTALPVVRRHAFEVFAYSHSMCVKLRTDPICHHCALWHTPSFN